MFKIKRIEWLAIALIIVGLMTSLILIALKGTANMDTPSPEVVGILMVMAGMLLLLYVNIQERSKLSEAGLNLAQALEKISTATKLLAQESRGSILHTDEPGDKPQPEGSNKIIEEIKEA